MNKRERLIRLKNEEAVELALEHAHLALQAKERLGHGDFQAWVVTNCVVGLRREQEYRYLLKHEPKARASAHLGIDGALQEIRAEVRGDDAVLAVPLEIPMCPTCGRRS